MHDITYAPITCQQDVSEQNCYVEVTLAVHSSYPTYITSISLSHIGNCNIVTYQYCRMESTDHVIAELFGYLGCSITPTPNFNSKKSL